MASAVVRSRLLTSLRRSLLLPSPHIIHSHFTQHPKTPFQPQPGLVGLLLTHPTRPYSDTPNWTERLKIAWDGVVDAVRSTGQKAKELTEQVAPHARQVLDENPNVKEVVFPLGAALLGTTLAWLVMPGIFRRLHKYASRTPMFGTQVPYEKSFWGALEDPVRYLVTFIALTQIGMLVAPSTIAMQYAGPVYRGTVIVSLIWFLYRWKNNVVSRALASGNTVIDQDKMYTLDTIGSVGLFVIGLMALAESCGVAVQSILTIGGIGGVATAFAAKDILGNILSGLSMQFFRPFSLGDTIKAGSIEGQVVEMGLTSTLLVNAEKFPILVPNSLFSSQVIVNKSRAIARAFITKIPLTLDSLDEIPQISKDIKIMLNSNQLVFKDYEAPYCFLSRIESSFAELTIGFNLKHMSKAELYATQQDILVQAVEIIKRHGGNLGSTLQSTDGC